MHTCNRMLSMKQDDIVKKAEKNGRQKCALTSRLLNATLQEWFIFTSLPHCTSGTLTKSFKLSFLEIPGNVVLSLLFWSDGGHPV